ncbi:hypothetical protein EAE89_20240 [Photorhabdus heterorhabditis]|nr:hypothetical protein [Photorhabdus heterorhabditis]
MNLNIPFILQVAALLAALTHPSHIVLYAPGIRSLAVAIHLEIFGYSAFRDREIRSKQNKRRRKSLSDE